MTTILKWRLSKLPTVDELLKLVNDKVITQEEAKEILFNKETENERDNESLKSEIKFLREIIDNLSKNKSATVVEIVKSVNPTWVGYDWYRPYTSWCNGITPYTTNSSLTLTNSVGLLASSEPSKFSDIETF